MPKLDKDVVPGFDVQVIYPQTGIPPQVNAPMGSPLAPNGNGYVVMPVQGTVVPVQQQQAQAAPQPSVIVLTLGPKKDDDKPKKEVSSVFQRL